MKGIAIKYTDEELAWIKKNSLRPRKEAHQEFLEKFGRSEISLVSYNALCKRKGWMTGRTGRIEKGNVSWNKGKKMPYNANSAKTQFRKGQAPHNTKQMGNERLSRDGYIELNIGRKTKHNQHGFYILKHIYLWEKENGALPDGMCLKCQDGNRQNCAPSNWSAIPRGVLPFLNGRYDGINYDYAPEHIKPSVMLLAKVRHARSALKKLVEVGRNPDQPSN